MTKYSLNGQWILNYINNGAAETLPAQAPGSVYADLLANGKMDDPYWRDNELQALELMENDYAYSKHFIMPQDFAGGKLRLVCEGLDTIADIHVNGKHVGYADNMHRIWKFDLDGLLPGENVIKITFRSPLKYIRQQDALFHADGSPDAMRGFPRIRKAHCMFGWDWGARLPDAGIWKDIYIESVPEASLDDVLIIQEHKASLASLFIKPEASLPPGGCGWTVEAVAASPSGAEFKSHGSLDGFSLGIDNPELWYPNGYGAQPLYLISVTLLKDGAPVDCWSRRIGLRTATVRRERDEWGESFEFCVNGISIFAMGADYIPEDHILSRINAERTKILLEDCVKANMNCIRVWGGAFYPHDYFYDVCDELGLLVWQDFMFACAIIELTPEFKENIKQELICNIKRLRHHASLGLFCGNNEMEWQMLSTSDLSLESDILGKNSKSVQIGYKKWNYTPKQFGDYFRLFEELMPSLVLKHAPQTFYWPASPSSGGSFDKPNDETRGDSHFWDVWHGERPFSAYRDYFFRFASEFGFQSFPDIKTVNSFTLPEDRNVFSYVFEKHQRNNSANGIILKYLGQNYLYPSNFEQVIYASQLLQADAVKYGVEHFRRNRGRCMGAVYWQLNDCWPVSSWASIDYFGRWKALHYYAKRFFAPVLLSACEEGYLTQGADVNRESTVYEKSAKLSVSNETLESVKGTVKWALRDACAKVLSCGSFECEIPPLSSLWLEKLDFPQADMHSNYLSFELESKGSIISSGTVMFCPPKHFKFVDAQLELIASEDEITVKSSAYAKSVNIYSIDSDILLSDNFFDLNSDEKTVKILRGSLGDIRVRSAADIGRAK
ncbi:MAG: glycoside hydrolase family 2 protein [Clostridiales bacterium]|jgi:beta-mannosidase|nr:glycoside hydrolase family 2 protein [Clostridiales bacterium]